MGHTHIPFRLRGQLEGYTASKNGKVRDLRLKTNQGSYSVKLSSASRVELLKGILSKTVVQGSWLEITGLQKISQKGVTKSLKAKRVISTVEKQVEKSIAACMRPPERSQPLSSKKIKILVCQKSACCKQGSGKVQQVIEQTIKERNLGQQVCVKAVGCLKQCSKGPNIIIGETQYCNIATEEIAPLLDQHFASPKAKCTLVA